jgi:DHA3 family tetracycline resistance protein-like MFS transporter
VALPFLVESLHANVGTLGLLNSMASVGLLLGVFWLGRFPQWRRRGILAYGATMMSGAALLVFGLPVGLPALAAAALFGGLFISIFSLIWVNTLQEFVPRELLGRVSSIDALGSFVLLPIGFGLAGWATDRLGAPLVFIIGGSATIALAALALVHPQIRNLD